MILFVDDEKRYMDSYIDELRMCGFPVSFQDNVDTALKYLQANSEQIKLIILDIMMPAGSSFKDVDTQRGLRTGIHVFEQIRRTEPHIPIMIFTNVSDEMVAERFRREKNCRFLRKEQYFPFELVEEVRMFLGDSKRKF